MRPTIRGWTVLIVVAASVSMGWQFGPRALNAVVTPLLVALVAGVVTTYRVDRPDVRRIPVAGGFVGDERTVEIVIAVDSTASATVRDGVGTGLSVADVGAGNGDATTGTVNGGEPVLETTLAGEGRVGYRVRLEERGEHRVGPLAIVVEDVFGLVERQFTYDATTSVLAYPPVCDLRDGPGRDLRAVVETVAGRDREEFDHLREYRRGDSLRDVHWKSAAKRPDADLVVTEYVDDEEVGSATVAAEGSPDRDDELATAAASVTSHLLEAGVSVGVSLPSAERSPGSGRDHHRDLLGLYAVLEGGELEDETRRAADVLVRTDAAGTRVVVDGREIPFDRLAVSRDGPDRDERATRDRPRGDGSGVVT